MLRITRRFVEKYASRYDGRLERDAQVEIAIQQWIRRLPEPKHLDKKRFVRLACWKTPRQRRAYEANSGPLVNEATTLAYQASNQLVKLHILMALEGVSVAVASTILYFLHPESFPIFDFHARSTLQKAGQWKRPIGDSSPQAWIEYVAIMRRLAGRLGVTLRELDKALFAYDKWGPR